MLTQQLFSALWFYFIFSLFAGWGWFLVARFLPRHSSLTYFLAKPIGLALFGYLIWLLSSVNILNYQNNFFINSLFFTDAIAGVGYFLVCLALLPAPERKNLIKNILWLELITLLLYGGYLYLRSFNPAAYGTERFMDMTLLNSSLKAEHFPFIDAWYAGKTVNYYYYGHYLVSLLTKLSSLGSFLTYNFALAWLYALCFTLAGFLVYLATNSKWFAAAAGFLVTTAGSLYYGSCVLNSWLNNAPACSYASSTRLYTPSYIINEIPSYSFTVGDLHAHFLALPWFLLNLILIYLLAKQEKINKVLSLCLALGLVTSALVNPSDITSLASLLAVFWLYQAYSIYKPAGSLKQLFKQCQFWSWLIWALALGAILLILYLPFLLGFRSPVLGFGWSLGFALKHNFFLNGHQYPTPALALLGMWGFFAVSIAAGWWFCRKQPAGLSFPILCFVSALILIVFVELFFIKDIYSITNPPFFRANTVFKYGYHTWTLLAVAFAMCSSLVFDRLSQNKRLKPIASVAAWVLVVFLFLSSFYPVEAVQQYYSPQTWPATLDAAAFMQEQSAGDLATVNYINQNFPSRSVVLEAAGDSYSYFARISAFTGMIAPIGWKSHEWTWRFDGKQAELAKQKDPNANVETGYGPIVKMAADIKTIYKTASVSRTRQLLSKYGIDYVYIGDLERTTYPNLQEQKFDQLGRLIFQAHNSKLYQIGLDHRIGHSGKNSSPRKPLSSSAGVLLPRTEADGWPTP